MALPRCQPRGDTTTAPTHAGYLLEEKRKLNKISETFGGGKAPCADNVDLDTPGQESRQTKAQQRDGKGYRAAPRSSHVPVDGKEGAGSQQRAWYTGLWGAVYV